MKQKKFDKKVKGRWWNFLSLGSLKSKGIAAFLCGGGAGVSFPQGRTLASVGWCVRLGSDLRVLHF